MKGLEIKVLSPNKLLTFYFKCQVVAIDNFVNAVKDPTGKTEHPESLIRSFLLEILKFLTTIFFIK